MSTTLSAVLHRAPNRLGAALHTFGTEALALASALLTPREILRDVERMRALLVEANRVSETDPQRAEALRLEASAIGLR